jgi:3-methyladenine DNA glycosylase Tag
MKYLIKFNESSLSANNYKFRRDVLPSEIEDILEPLKDDEIISKVEFISSDLKRILIDFKIINKFSNIESVKNNLKSVLESLISYLKFENFKMDYMDEEDVFDHLSKCETYEDINVICLQFSLT